MYANLIFTSKLNDITIGLFIDNNGRPFVKHGFETDETIPQLARKDFETIVRRMVNEYTRRTSI